MLVGTLQFHSGKAWDYVEKDEVIYLKMSFLPSWISKRWTEVMKHERIGHDIMLSLSRLHIDEMDSSTLDCNIIFIFMASRNIVVQLTHPNAFQIQGYGYDDFIICSSLYVLYLIMILSPI